MHPSRRQGGEDRRVSPGYASDVNAMESGFAGKSQLLHAISQRRWIAGFAVHATGVDLRDIEHQQVATFSLLPGMRGGITQQLAALAMGMNVALHDEILRGGETSLFVSRANSTLVDRSARTMWRDFQFGAADGGTSGRSRLSGA